MKSLAILLSLKPSVIYPAHGSVIAEPVVAIQAYLDHRKQRETEILASLERSYPADSSVDDLVTQIYPVNTKESF